MPIPKPKPGQKKDNFISGCMSDLKDEYTDIPQRYAICIGSWEEKFSSVVGMREIDKKSIKKFAESKFAGERVSIDFDDTLNTERGKELYNRLKNEGKDIHIVTRRQQDTASKEVYDLAEELGINRSKIHFTNGQLKWKTLQRLGIETHYDNNPDEINAINTNTTGIRAIKFSD